MVDLEQEGEQLLDVLLPAEELRTAVPGLRNAADVASPVLIGITDRRVLVVGRSAAAGPGGGPGLRATIDVDDVTGQVNPSRPLASLQAAGGIAIELDLDDDALQRLRAALDRVAGGTGVG